MDKLQQLLDLNVKDYTEKKNGLTYLSWANAWREFIKVYPQATYIIKKDINGLPYFGTESMGYMCYTTVTANDLTLEMWLPVMDGANKAMKKEAYDYKTKYADKSCAAVDMFDVNKTIMRCLTKNLAMFGLGLYIYAGEDIPEEDKTPEKPVKVTTADMDKLVKIADKKGIDYSKLSDYAKKKYTAVLTKLTAEQYVEMLKYVSSLVDSAKKVE